jgi:plasmid stabilization system protein ParE
VKVRYAETAIAEIEEILSYIAECNRTAAIAVRARIERTVSALALTPEMAQRTDEPGVRRMPVGSYPYLIFYTIEGDEVVILRVRHRARRPPW